MANENLGNAKREKNDEFYTQYADIEKEMNAYLEFNPDVFRNKTVLLPCDDPSLEAILPNLGVRQTGSSPIIFGHNGDLRWSCDVLQHQG
jgi:hypothetical protein